MSEHIQYFKTLFEAGESRNAFDEKIADFFPAIIYIYDVDTKHISFLNRKVHDFLGFSYEDIGGDLNELIFKEDIELVQHELEKFYALQNNDSYCFNCRLNHKEGYWRYFRTHGTVMRRAETGQPASFLFIAQDITDFRKSEEEVKAVRSLIEETEELLQLGSWTYTIADQKITWTKGLYQLLEFEEDDRPDIIYDFYVDLVSAEDIASFEHALQDAISTKSGFEQEYQVKTRTGATKIVSTKAKVVTNTDGDAIKVVGITRDITRLRNFERDRDRSIRELNRSNKELEEFAYIASHDLQEPIRKISTFGERLKAKFIDKLGPDGGLYLERIMASAENMRMLIDNLLEFSRTSRSSYAFEWINLQDIIANVKTDLELKIEETNASIVTSALPRLEAVASEMKQLFNNLLSNAIKFRKPAIAPVIKITSSKASKTEKEEHHLPVDKEFFKLQVSDNGIGFEEEYADRIFQIFQRLHGKAEYPGSGIGLAICKKIIDNHNGIMYAESKPDSGATFVVILPEKQS
jgi:PAS domain S-box-containing protein